MPGTASRLQDYDDVAGRLKLHRQRDSRPAVIVEGPADARFISRLLGDRAATFIAGTRNRVVAAGVACDALGLRRVAAVMDRDFDDLVRSAEGGRAIIPYDGGDLEHMLVCSRVFDELLFEFGSDDKVRAFGGVETVRQAAITAATFIARVRRFNATSEIGIEFREEVLRRRIDRRSLRLSVGPLCDALARDVDRASVSDIAHVAASGDLPFCPHTGVEIVRGKDCLTVVGVALRQLVGSKPLAQTKPEVLAESLRLAATPRALSSTNWWARLVSVLELETPIT